MLWSFIKFLALGCAALLVLLALLSLLGAWGLGVGVLLALAWALPGARR